MSRARTLPIRTRRHSPPGNDPGGVLALAAPPSRKARSTALVARLPASAGPSRRTRSGQALTAGAPRQTLPRNGTNRCEQSTPPPVSPTGPPTDRGNPIRLSRQPTARCPWVGMSDQRPKRTYTVEEAARELGISRSTAYECVRTGEIPCLRFRSRIVIVAAVIDQMLSASPASSGPADDIGW